MAAPPRKTFLPQRLCAQLQNFISRRLSAVEVGGMVNQGLDGGTEFSFLVQGRDGSEMMVSVVQTKPADLSAPSPSGKWPKSMALARIAQKDARAIEEQRTQNYRAKVERRRLRFLGELPPVARP